MATAIRATSFHPGFLNSETPPGYGGHPQQLLNIDPPGAEKRVTRCAISRKPPNSLAIAQCAYLSEARGKKAVTLAEFKKYAGTFSNADDLLHELLASGVKRGGSRP